MEFSQSVSTAVEKVVASGVIEETVTKAVEETIKRSINDQFRSYGGFGKQIDAAVEQALKFEAVNLPSYNDLVVKLIRQIVQKNVEDSLAQQVVQRVEDLLEPPPAKLELSKLVEMYVKRIRENNDDGCVCYGESTARVEVTRDGDIGLFHKIKLFESESDKEPEIFIGVNTYDGRDSDPIPGHIYHLRFKKVNVESQMFVEDLHGIERMLFQMKAAGNSCQIILDDFSHVDLSTESHDH